jgi:hypothetical protein
MFRSILLAVAGSLCLNAGTVAYTDFGPGQTYDTSSGYGIQNLLNGNWEAPGFIATATGTLSQVDVPLVFFQVTPATLPLTISLETNNGGFPSGTVLESWTVSAASVTTTPQIFSLASVLNPTITSGTQYWLVGSTNDVNGYVWLINSIGLLGDDYNNGSGGFQYQPASPTLAFDVIVGSSPSGVPEPGSAALTMIGALILFGAVRLRRSHGPRLPARAVRN